MAAIAQYNRRKPGSTVRVASSYCGTLEANRVYGLKDFFASKEEKQQIQNFVIHHMVRL